MRTFISLFIVGIVIALALLVAILNDPGYVRISVGHWLIESNLWVMVTLNLILITVIIFALQIKGVLTNSSKSIFTRLGLSGAQRANTNTEKGLLAALEGNWKQANKLLSRSASNSSKPVINYLAAAHAANKFGQVKDAELLLKKAYEDTSDSDFAIGIVQAQIQFEQQKYEPCLATLLRLKKQQSSHPSILKLLKNVYLKLEDWQQLVNLIPALRKELKMSEDKSNTLELLAWNKLFIQKSDEILNTAEQAPSAEALAILWKKLPKNLRFDTSIIKIYAEQLIRIKHEPECEALLRKLLAQHWHDELISLYGTVKGNAPSEQLITAENWLKERPQNAALLISLGRLSLRNKRWNKALEYFEASNNLQNSLESQAEICRLTLHMNPDENQHMLVFDALIQSLNLPELPMP